MPKAAGHWSPSLFSHPKLKNLIRSKKGRKPPGFREHRPTFGRRRNFSEFNYKSRPAFVNGGRFSTPGAEEQHFKRAKAARLLRKSPAFRLELIKTSNSHHNHSREAPNPIKELASLSKNGR
ncbi:unnamed protein product [Cuscuta epithymum]|uniref:Uncharacterized protein n=1 Tax=Cuscuta epithymum TaxID=186058 RepID=A0AAV0CWT3_9ASTE|nr:unnamed protein product [Cuscuta epithymum]